jgi:hypothetical protein
MIILCCFDILGESQINWGETGEILTGFGTLVLAGVTVLIAIYARTQLKDIKTFIKQNENLTHVQSAENNILKQIEFHYKILERIEVNKKDAFRIMYENLKGNYGFEKGKSSTIEGKISVAFTKLYGEYGYLLGHYYRNLYRIVKNISDIDETKIIGFDKKYYAKLVRAQLSEYEIILLFYNCIWVNDEDEFKTLIENYEFLEGINYSKLFDRGHYKLYSEKAFGIDLV